MTIRANAFVLKKDIDLPHGAIFCVDKRWFLRALIHRDWREGDLEVGIHLATAEDHTIELPTNALTLADGLAYEARVMGEVSGPGAPPKASLVWRADGGHAIAMDDLFMCLSGKKAMSIQKTSAYFATRWGVWVIDADGKDVSREPLAIVDADVVAKL
ncbi:hypothetical protein [Xanthomonas hortorum]|uniref:hypothetical protein n=1 Tax=Xanthomonas hortorum TaxID=56454 RepID=UPI0032E8A9CD